MYLGFYHDVHQILCKVKIFSKNSMKNNKNEIKTGLIFWFKNLIVYDDLRLKYFKVGMFFNLFFKNSFF